MKNRTAAFCLIMVSKICSLFVQVLTPDLGHSTFCAPCNIHTYNWSEECDASHAQGENRISEVDIIGMPPVAPTSVPQHKCHYSRDVKCG